MSTSASSTTYSYDGFGRIATNTQTTGRNGPYTFTYGYSLTDQLTSMIYPVSGHQVTYGLDSADRLTSIQNVSAGNNYAQNLGYTADGSLMSATLGTGLTQSLTWNDRIQPTGVAVNNAGSQNLLTLGLFPCAGAATSCSSGNRNVGRRGSFPEESRCRNPGVGRGVSSVSVSPIPAEDELRAACAERAFRDAMAKGTPRDRRSCAHR